MSEHTGIAWANSTFNPWIGCTKVSAGCKNCYAETMDRTKFSRTLGGGTKENPVGHWGPGAPRYRTSASTWRHPLEWDRRAAETGTTRRVFPSLCDWLDGEVQVEWFVDFLFLMFRTRNLTWLALTKRIENLRGHLAKAVKYACFNAGRYMDKPGFVDWLDDWAQGKPPVHVWVGASVEDQPTVDLRVPQLLTVPVAKRFLSVEPLLESVRIPKPWTIDWVIVGGESGPNRRDCGVWAICDVAHQCASTRCFVKQDCAASPGRQGRIPDSVWARKEFPA